MKNKVNYIAVAIITIFLTTFVLNNLVLAESNESELEKGSTGLGIGTGLESAVLRPNGDFRVTGVTVNSVSSTTNSINVSFYGFTRDVNIGNAKITGGGKNLSINDIVAGDKISATGTYDKNTRVITVKKIFIINYKNRSDKEKRIQELMDQIKKLQERLEKLRTQ